MSNKTAVVVGATGATGSHLVSQLLAHPSYSKVVVLARRELQIRHDKLTTHIIDFDQPDTWQQLVVGDELYSALGTTLKLAGSKQAQYKVDVTYQLNVAKAAKANGVSKLLLVSSPNANAKSASFYLKMKGELDDAVKSLGFDQCVLIKPSIILGHRPEGRPGEKIGGMVLSSLTSVILPLRKYRPISAEQLATAMLNIAQQDIHRAILEVELGDLFKFCE